MSWVLVCRRSERKIGGYRMTDSVGQEIANRMRVGVDYVGAEMSQTRSKRRIRGATKEVMLSLINCFATRTEFQRIIFDGGLPKTLDANRKQLMNEFKMLNPQ